MRVNGWKGAAALLLAASLLGGAASHEHAAAPPLGDLGVEVLGIRPSAAGYMLDFRFRIVDPAKAAPLLDRQVEPRVIDKARGAELVVPTATKVGQLRQVAHSPQPGQILSALFANPGRLVKPGDRVTVAFGDHRFADLTVGGRR